VTSEAHSDSPSQSTAPPVPVDPGRRTDGRARAFQETVVLDRDPAEPEMWSFGHVIDGAIGVRGHLRHDPSTHESTLTSGHGGGLFTTAALLVHLACLRTERAPSTCVYDVATRRIEMHESGTYSSGTNPA
jgi:hypothetical protein